MEQSPTTRVDMAPIPQYLFIVARDRPDMLARVRERFDYDPRVEVIVDRRHGERRASVIARVPERRRGDRRRPTKIANNISVHPVVVAQKRVASYAELQEQIAALSRECEALRKERDDLTDIVGGLHRDLKQLALSLAAATAALERLRSQADMNARRPT